jgi:predicted nucleic acid-binding protein
MRYLIDSNTFIDLLKPRNPDTDKIAESLLLGDDLVIFCLVEYEVKRGYYHAYFSKQSNDVQKNKEQSRIEHFDKLIHSFEYISQIEPQIIQEAASVYGQTNARGRVFPDIDILILVVGKRDGCTIVSSDTHIEALTRMYDVPFEKWT